MAHLLERCFNRKTVRCGRAIAAGLHRQFLLAFCFFWVVALLGSQQVRQSYPRPVAPRTAWPRGRPGGGRNCCGGGGGGRHRLDGSLVSPSRRGSTLEMRVQGKGSNISFTTGASGWLAEGETIPIPSPPRFGHPAAGGKPYRRCGGHLDPEGRREPPSGLKSSATLRAWWHRRGRLATGGGQRACPSRAAHQLRCRDSTDVALGPGGAQAGPRSGSNGLCWAGSRQYSNGVAILCRSESWNHWRRWVIADLGGEAC